MRLAIVLAVASAACSASRPEPRAAPAPALDAAVVEPRAEPTGPSLYDLPMSLRRASGDVVALDVDRGHTTLVSMFYGSCATACPVLMGRIGDALAQLPEAARRDARVLLVSFDAARDTPARLRELAAAHHLDDRWTLASASDADARALAAMLGIRYRAVAGGQFFHTTAIVALDRDGRTLARMDGLGDPAPLVAALAAR